MTDAFDAARASIITELPKNTITTAEWIKRYGVTRTVAARELNQLVERGVFSTAIAGKHRHYWPTTPKSTKTNTRKGSSSRNE